MRRKIIYGDGLMAEFTHFDNDGKAHMVDVGSKPATARRAVVKGHVKMAPSTLKMICDGTSKKGDVLAIARLAGIMGAKQTAALIPLCHPMGLDYISIDLDLDGRLPGVMITATCSVTGSTGVEMEAMTAVSVAGLTIYDMCKAVDRSMEIGAIRLTHKSGGKSGVFDGE